MKRFLSISIFLLALCFTSCAVAQSTTPRFGTTKNKDNTGRVLTYAYSAPTYADTIAVTPNAYETFYKVDTLTGNSVITATVTKVKACDKVTFMFAADSARTVTFGTNFVPSATLVVDSAQKATATFIFNGTKFLEYSRAKE